MTQADPTPESLQSPSAGASSPVRVKPPAAPMGALVWLSMIPVIVVVFLWVYSGWKEYSKDFRHGTDGTMLRSDLGVIQIIRYTRSGPSNPMAGEKVNKEWTSHVGLDYRDSATNDGNSTRKTLSIPFWMILAVVAILPVITVARAQRRAKRGFETAIASIV